MLTAQRPRNPSFPRCSTFLKAHAFSRLYLNFKSFEPLLEFCNAFNGKVFKDDKGMGLRA